MDGIGGKVETHAELSTGVIVSNGSKCISFWYNMESVTGVQGSKLELFQTKEKGKSSLLKAYINSTETRWIRETLDLPGSLPYRIIFHGTVFEQWNNYIGLDDIDILPESCSGGNISEENMPGENISENRFFQEHCLDFDDNFTIDGCPFLYLDTSKLRLVFEPAVETSNMECQEIENKTKDNLFSRCEEGAFSGCDVNQYAIISFGMSKEQECITYNKDIVLEYSCTELPSINEYSTVPYNKEETMDMTGVAVAIVACVGLLIVCLIITGICVFKRKTEKQRILNIDKTCNKTGSMNINKTKEVQSTPQRDVSLLVHEYIDIDLSKETLCSDQTKHKENIFEYELAKPLTSDTGGAFRYDLAKPLSEVVKNGRSTDFCEFNTPKDCSEYDTTKMNDSTKYNGYNETENIVVYSRTFDGVYDVTSSGKRNVTSDNTYEHCALQDKQ
ncbi:uncharacterized protein LOC143046802 [Mytilus galloprovincialis]|uniref:uncharacterized protein LOC143046802 n=1 Tax=Mytilus galloprovincialis TaxID=29158 RepID=UPI003F7C37AB